MLVMMATPMTDADDRDAFDDGDAGACGGVHSGDRCRYEDDEGDDDDAADFLPSELYEGRRGHRGLGEWHPPRVGAGKAWRDRSSAPATGRHGVQPSPQRTPAAKRAPTASA